MQYGAGFAIDGFGPQRFFESRNQAGGIMPVEVSVGRHNHVGNNRNHAEEVMFLSGRHGSGNLAVTINAWPCTGERHHDCHRLFAQQSLNRTIVVTITGDHAGYSANHPNRVGGLATGTITYTNGQLVGYT